MKKVTFLLVAIMVSVLFSCKQNSNNEMEHDNYMHQDSTMMHQDSSMMHDDEHMMNSEVMYSCPMHPKVHGDKNNKCSECGMALTVVNTKTVE